MQPPVKHSPARTASDTSRVIMWGLIPLLTVVFAAGGGWYLVGSIDDRLSALEDDFSELRDASAKAGLSRRVDALETEIQDQDRRLSSIEGNVIAICVATGAQCARP